LCLETTRLEQFVLRGSESKKPDRVGHGFDSWTIAYGPLPIAY